MLQKDELSSDGAHPPFCPKARARPSAPGGDLRILRLTRLLGKPGIFSRNFVITRLTTQEISSCLVSRRISPKLKISPWTWLRGGYVYTNCGSNPPWFSHSLRGRLFGRGLTEWVIFPEKQHTEQEQHNHQQQPYKAAPAKSSTSRCGITCRLSKFQDIQGEVTYLIGNNLLLTLF